jgi:hypothetical protein
VTIAPLLVKIAPIALFWAFSPLLIAFLIMLLSSDRPILKGLAFALPSIAGSIVFGLVLFLAIGVNNLHHHDKTSRSLYTVQVVIGAVFLLLALLWWWKGPRAGRGQEMPKWIDQIDRVSPALALAIGLIRFFMGTIYVVAAVTDILLAQVGAINGTISILLFVGVGTMGLWVPVSYRILAPEQSLAHFTDWRDWLIRNNRIIVIFEFACLGGLELVKGLVGLVR